jgi:leucyl aminopeptidase (aminopeptidase T)
MASKMGARYLSLPDYSLALLSSPALRVNFRDLTPQASRLAGIFNASHEVSVSTALGTNIILRIDGRQANPCPGWCDGPGSLASPPNAETNIAPVESFSHGVVIVDGSILCNEIGLLETPINLDIDEGRINRIEGVMADRLEKVLGYPRHPGTRVLAELGIGLNPKAKVCGIMLEDEGCLGTIHMGFGSNTTIGGKNGVPFHLDMVIRDASLEADGKKIMESGRFLI